MWCSGTPVVTVLLLASGGGPHLYSPCSCTLIVAWICAIVCRTIGISGDRFHSLSIGWLRMICLKFVLVCFSTQIIITPLFIWLFGFVSAPFSVFKPQPATLYCHFSLSWTRLPINWLHSESSALSCSSQSSPFKSPLLEVAHYLSAFPLPLSSCAIHSWNLWSMSWVGKSSFILTWAIFMSVMSCVFVCWF